MKPPIDFDGVEAHEQAQVAARQQAMLGGAGKPLLGVAFSGGGIRSATFNLGIVQGLAKSGLLPRVDYLSTVSGGGFVGTWLHGVIKRHAGGDPRRPDLKSLLTRPESVPHGEAADDPIVFLRNYSSYLAPDMGLFSADFWVMVAIWFRNMMLNLLVLIPFLVVVSLIPLLLGAGAGWYVNFDKKSFAGELLISSISVTLLFLFAAKGVGSVARRGAQPVTGDPTRAAPPSRWDSASNAATCGALVLFTGMGLALASDDLNDGGWLTSANAAVTLLGMGLGFTVLFALVQWQGNFAEVFRRRHGSFPWFGSVAYPLMGGLATGALCLGVMKALVGLDGRNAAVWHSVAWGPPLLSLAMLTGGSLHIGLMGVDYDDGAREWLARLCAYVYLFAFAWSALFAIAVFGPYWMAELAEYSWAPLAGIGGAWIVTAAAGAFAGKRSSTPAQTDGAKSGGVMSVVAAVAPPVFVIGLLLFLSFAVHQTVARLIDVEPTANATSAPAPVPQQDSATAMATSVPAPVTLQISATATGAQGISVDVKKMSKVPPAAVTAALHTERALLMQERLASDESQADFIARIEAMFLLLLGASAIVLYLPRRVDVNEFSMQNFYKNRLVRCYLGATHGRERKPSRVTGFDPNDDFLLRDLVAEKSYFGPYALVNSCINLNQGVELAKQERKGSAFLFSPLYVGYDVPRTSANTNDEAQESNTLHPNGYRPTEGFSHPDGFQIGTCMGISGAAASPNDGAATSGPLAFLMTILCVRMAWWVGNPRRDGPSSRPGPTYSLAALLSELFAVTNASSNYVNLSDGGHFENLGLYQLVRRRCAFIIAGDGEQDDDYNFGSLGGAIRKCRTDFGAEIDIDPRRIKLKDGASGTHCVVGRITYALRPGETKRTTGWLLYLKSSVTGDEEEDITQYKSTHPTFPQETTANQFFTESQFESYRKLGLHVWNTAFENVDLSAETLDLEHVFETLYHTWYPPTDVPEGVATRHADAHSRLVGKLSDPVLARLIDQVIAPAGNLHDVVAEMPHLSAEEQTKAFLYTLELVQLVENVWTDLRMAEKMQRESPANAGWIKVFRYWAAQPMFRHAWARTGYSHDGLFQQFYTELSLARTTEPPVRLPA